jgi:hypothetical protein
MTDGFGVAEGTDREEDAAFAGARDPADLFQEPCPTKWFVATILFPEHAIRIAMR